MFERIFLENDPEVPLATNEGIDLLVSEPLAHSEQLSGCQTVFGELVAAVS